MSDGVTISVSELIALKQLALSIHAIPAEAKTRSPGSYQSRLRGRGMEFSEIRNYQAGDEIRHMEWRVTARTGRPHVKLYHEEKERPVFIVTDFNPSMYFGTKVAFKSVVAAKITALLAWRAISQGDKVGGLIFSNNEHQEFPPYSRHTHVMKMLNCLSYYTTLLPTQKTNTVVSFSQMLQTVRRVNKPGSLIILVSDFYSLDKESDAHLMHLRQHNDVMAFHVFDSIEQALPLKGLYPVTNYHDALFLDAQDPRLNAAYQAYWTERYILLEQRFHHLNLHYNRVSTEENLSKVLALAFPRRHHGA